VQQFNPYCYTTTQHLQWTDATKVTEIEESFFVRYIHCLLLQFIILLIFLYILSIQSNKEIHNTQ